MKLKISIYTLLVVLFAACSSEEPKDDKVFKVDFAQTKSVGSMGETFDVPVTSTESYVPMASEPSWCAIETHAEGFKVTVLPNNLASERTFDLVVTAVGFTPYKITITQDAGSPGFNIEIEERSKTFSQEGGSMMVLVNGNVEYTVESSESWCAVSDISAQGFKITAPVNGIAPRTAVLQVKPAGGFANVTINVKQSGMTIIKNPSFVGGKLDNWTTSGTENLFTMATDSYIVPNSPEGAHYVTKDFAATPDVAYEGRLIQHITDIPDGKYTLSCQFAGYMKDAEGVYLIFIDKNGTETKKLAAIPGGSWKLTELSCDVTGGECSVGLYVKYAQGETTLTYFKAMNFDFQ